MKVNKYKPKTERPFFCANCQQHNTWEQKPSGNILGVGGYILWECWMCVCCGKTKKLSTKR